MDKLPLRQHPAARRFMAIDAGSNATKYRVWEIDPNGAARQIHQGRMAVRLGRTVFTTGQIQDPIIEQAIETFRYIRAEADSMDIKAIRAVGTSALREARNASDLIRQVRETSDITLEVLSEDNEARLIAKGLRWREPSVAFPFALIDIGGGSSEVILAESEAAVAGVSLPLGAVRLSEHVLIDTPPTAECIAAAQRMIEDVLSERLPTTAGAHPWAAIGSSGTVTTLERMAQVVPELLPRPGLILHTQISAIMEQMQSMTHREIVETFGIEHERAQIILAGAMILERLMRRLGVEQIRLVLTGVADGLLADYLEGSAQT